MTVVCRKTGFPIECPYCGKRSGRPNGPRQALAKGQMQQVHCSACERQWSVPIDEVEPLFFGKRIHLRIDRLLMAFALFVVGIPMCRVESLVRIKAETVKAQLLYILESGRWEELETILAERFKIPRAFRSEFDTYIVWGYECGQADFAGWAKVLRRQHPADRAKSARLASRILGRPVKITEITARSKRGRMRL